MAIMDGRDDRWAEFVVESTMGITPTNPTMNAFFGEFIGASVVSGAEFDKYNVLQGVNVADPLSSGKTVKTGETHKVTIKCKPSSLTWLPYALMGATSSTYATGKVPHYMSIGLVADDEYSVMKGCILEKATFEIPNMKSSAMLTLEYLCAEKTDWSTSDYIGTGSHASPITDTPYTMSDVSSILYDASAPSASDILIESLKFAVGYKIEPVTDLSSAFASKIGDYAFLERAMPLDLSMTLMGASVQNDLLDGSDHTFAFTLDSKDFTFSALKWANAPAMDLNPVTKVGMSLSSDPEATRLAIA